MEFTKYLSDHWVEIAAALGLGSGGGGLLTKGMSDKKGSKALKSLDDRLTKAETSILMVKKDVETNTLFDKQFREQTAKDYESIKSEVSGVNTRLDKIIGHLLKSES